MNGVAVSSMEMTSPVTPPIASPGVSNAVRLVAQSLARCAQHKSGNEDSFSQLCITLSRGLDYAIANKEVPAQVSELPTIFKLVCQRRNECSLQAAIMVLMFTVKNACKAQWFSSQESQELLSLADEMVGFFCTTKEFSCEQPNIIPTVSKIMSRYYPHIKLGDILVAFAIKPGFEACAVDFYIPKIVNRAATERINLLVAVKDNIDTSSCIINPPKVNILLNGVGLQGRVIDCMYQGPQLPTNVNTMLRYGTNLVQVIGQFDAHCIVLISYMSVIRPSDLPSPHDYHQPPAAAVDSEAEIVDGPSKISLNCPISLKRIRQPVKGHLCKHLQCFDLNNYMEINFKCPSWKCPYCNQPVCYPDIRIDQKMVKILQDVSEGVTSVLVHSDGSWEEATTVGANHSDESHAKVSEGLQTEQQEGTQGMEIDASNLYDLTQAKDDMISLDANAPEDRKAVVKSNLHGNSIYTNVSTVPVTGYPPQAIQNSADQVQGIPYSGPLGYSCCQAENNSRANPEHFVPSPVYTHSVPPTANREQQSFFGPNQQSSSPALGHPPFDYNTWMQQLQHGQMNGGYSIPGNVATQALTPNTFPQNSATASTSAYSAQMESFQQWCMSQSLLQQRLSAQMRGCRAPVQVTNNAFRAIPLPCNEAPHQPNSMHNMPNINYTFPHLRATSQVPTMRPSLPTGPSQMSAPGVNVFAEGVPSSGYGGMAQRVSRTEDLFNDEQNWQPTGRMRGSLAGRAYNEARDQLIIRPTQQTMPQTPNQNMLSSHLQALLANRNLHSQPNLSHNNCSQPYT